MSLADAGAKVELGSGVAAAQDYYRSATAALEEETDLIGEATPASP
jgi:hypothetical protein